jgi:DNA polymerase-3 subunit alpha
VGIWTIKDGFGTYVYVVQRKGYKILMYVSLHNHTKFSFLDGMISPLQLAKAAKELGHTSTAITDHGNITGAIEFYKACGEVGIKPIIGVEGYFVRDVDDTDCFRYHMILIAKNKNGLENIFQILTRANQHFYRVPRFDLDILRDHSEDVIVSTACMNGILSMSEGILDITVKKFYEVFEDDFYLEVMPFKASNQNAINLIATSLSKKYGIKLIATNDAHYINKSDSKYHNLLFAINTKSELRNKMEGLYLRPRRALFNDLKELSPDMGDHMITLAIENTLEIGEKVNIELVPTDIILPDLPIEDPDKELETIVKKRLQELDYPVEYQERLQKELDIIKNKGFSKYFLLVNEFITYMKNNNFRLGYGRGSAAGSLICYLLDISGVDPIKGKLLFERFLNPDRTDWPDIDIDVETSRRDEVIEWAKQRWGSEHVVNIGTISETQTKYAMKDVARVLGYDFKEVNEITKHIDNNLSLYENMKENEEVRKLVPKIPNFREYVDQVDHIRGTFRQAGTHAAGLVICPQEAWKYGVIERRKGQDILNWRMGDVSFFGLVKIDLLGLNALDKLAHTERLIKERHGEIQISKEHSDKAFEMFNCGQTEGIFQFESSSNKYLLKRFAKIKSVDTLIDINALGRPGPKDSGLTDLYIERYNKSMNGERWINKKPYAKYLQEITKDTYGIIIYQEQIIRILVELAGYTLAQADAIRRIIGKSKGAKEFEKYREEFEKGCATHSGIPAGVSCGLFNDLREFSRYGFNKSHSASYTALSFRQMLYKVAYSHEFMVPLFYWTKSDQKVNDLIQECRKLEIPIKFPDINTSQRGFSIEDDGFRVGFESIKGIGTAAIDGIMKERNKKEFRSLFDFRIRMPKRIINKRSFRSLVEAGAFDNLEGGKVSRKMFDENEQWFINLADSTIKNVKNFNPNDEPNIYSGEEYDKGQIMSLQAKAVPGISNISVQPKLGLNLDVERLDILRGVIGECTQCRLHKCHKGLSSCPFSFGKHSDLMVIGEAPGKNEVVDQKPFVGKAGKILFEEGLNKIGYDREDCYITNVFKCRPKHGGENSKLPPNPPKDCYKIIDKEIEILQPKLIVALGATAASYVKRAQTSITKIAGEVEICNIGGQHINVLFCLHPASMIYNREERQPIWDLTWKKLKEMI